MAIFAVKGVKKNLKQKISERISCYFQEGEVVEVVRRVEGGDKVTSCIDSEGNVVVATVYKREEMVNEESAEEKEGKEFGAKENEEEDNEEKKEVWVVEGEARRENLVLPGGREATALYQVAASLLTIS